MQYAVMIYRHSDEYEGLSGEERETIHKEYHVIGADPRVISGARLQPVETATTVRVQGWRVLTTDGLFADTKEVFGGIFVVEAGNLDEAVEIAARIPAARLGGSVEVRPIAERLDR